MGAYRILGGEILSEREFRSLDTAPDEGDGVPLDTDSAGKPVGFEPIGKGKPLTVLIREVYTGRYPEKGLLRKRKDIAVLSSVKNYDIFNASARALNFIIEGAERRTRKNSPSAHEAGTSVVSYSPAVIADSQIVSIELAVDDFPGELLNTVATAFSSLGQIPILLPHAGFLMAASGVTKLASNLGNSLFDNRPEFSFDLLVEFDMPGVPSTPADFRLLVDDGFDVHRYRYDPRNGLVDRDSGQRYEGDEPYVVVSLDGKKREELESFKSSVASAAVLQRFLDMKKGADASVETVVEGMKLLSDMKYRERALEVKKRMDSADEPRKTELKSQLDALIANIGNADLRP